MTALVTVAVLASCSTASETSDQARSRQSAEAPASTSARQPAPPHAGMPHPREDRRETGQPRAAVGPPSVLATRLNRATAILRDRKSAESDVRRAAELQQLAVSALGTASEGFRRSVTRRLEPETARLVGGMVRAARPLRSITAPQRRLPRWHIVAPPPADELLRYYREAQWRSGVPWTYLAAINLVETRMGRIRGTSSAGARGPMQFLPSTWHTYGAGADINDPEAAINAAARLLVDHGAPGDMAAALWHYNPSWAYVNAVEQYARTMKRWSFAYRAYWHWRVLYRHTRGTYLLPTGYPREPAVLVDPTESD